jgi:hypothetical protein
MKKIAYLYGSLLVAVAQSIIFQSMLSLIFKYGLDSGNIFALVVLIGVQVLLVTLDSRVRGYLWWYECVLDFIVSPIRFILQAVTIVLYHISGERDFANRGKYDRHFPYWIMYILFGTDTLKVGSRSSGLTYKPKKEKPHKTKAKKPKKEKPTPPDALPKRTAEEWYNLYGSDEAISKRFNESRFNKIQRLKGDLQEATVYIFGFVSWKEGWQSFTSYDVDKKYHKTARITGVYVDGTNFVCEPLWNKDDRPSIIGTAKLYLPKGTYYLSVNYEIGIPKYDFPGVGAPNKTITNKGRRDGIEITVTDVTKPLFVGVYANIGCQFNQYPGANGVVRVADLEWSLQSYSGVLSREQCKAKYNDDSGFEWCARGRCPDLSI